MLCVFNLFGSSMWCFPGSAFQFGQSLDCHITRQVLANGG